MSEAGKVALSCIKRIRQHGPQRATHLRLPALQDPHPVRHHQRAAGTELSRLWVPALHSYGRTTTNCLYLSEVCGQKNNRPLVRRPSVRMPRLQVGSRCPGLGLRGELRIALAHNGVKDSYMNARKRQELRIGLLLLVAFLVYCLLTGREGDFVGGLIGVAIVGTAALVVVAIEWLGRKAAGGD